MTLTDQSFATGRTTYGRRVRISLSVAETVIHGVFANPRLPLVGRQARRHLG